MSGFCCPSFNKYILFSFLAFSFYLRSSANRKGENCTLFVQMHFRFIASLIFNEVPPPEVSWKLKYKIRKWTESKNTSCNGAVVVILVR
jgi:hypothetical protein